MFKVPDPLGNKIVLTKKCWYNHILVEHPIMREFLTEVENTVKEADYIFQSKISEDSQLYFKSHQHKRFGEFYIVVVIERKQGKSTGYVRTSFPVYNLSKGGELIWKRD